MRYLGTAFFIAKDAFNKTGYTSLMSNRLVQFTCK